MRSSLFGAEGGDSTSLKRWPRAVMPAKRPERYSFCSGVNPILINIALVAFLGFEISNIGLGFFRVFAAGGLDDFMESGINVVGHSQSVAADVKVSAGFQPGPEFSGIFAQA